MSDTTKRHHKMKYSAESACIHCEGIVRCEHWCLKRNSNVYYAYAIVMDKTLMTVTDVLILHSLGVTWEDGKQLVN